MTSWRRVADISLQATEAQSVRQVWVSHKSSVRLCNPDINKQVIAILFRITESVINRRSAVRDVKYDSIGYDEESLTFAEKLTDRPTHLNLLHGNKKETKKRKITKKLKRTKLIRSENQNKVRLIVRGDSRDWGREYDGKDLWSSLSRWVSSGEWKSKAATNDESGDVTGVGGGESERESGMRLTESNSWLKKEKAKHIERNDQLFVTRMMLVAEQES